MQGYQYSATSMTPQAMRNLHKADVYKPLMGDRFMGGLLPHFFVIKIGDDVDVLDT